jgi:hypothetical protein
LQNRPWIYHPQVPDPITVLSMATPCRLKMRSESPIARLLDYEIG